jgi:protein FRA10AC1
MNLTSSDNEAILERHRKLVILALTEAGASSASRHITANDLDVIRAHHQFVRDEKADVASGSWEKRMALKYYRRLSKEYALADLSQMDQKGGKLGLRWRTDREVIEGRGQFSCGNKACSERSDLRSYELDFMYREDGEAKNELVKVRLCPSCAQKLFCKKIRKLEREQRKESKRRRTAKKSDDERLEFDPPCSYEISRKGDFDTMQEGHTLVSRALERFPDDLLSVKSRREEKSSFLHEDLLL